MEDIRNRYCVWGKTKSAETALPLMSYDTGKQAFNSLLTHGKTGKYKALSIVFDGKFVILDTEATIKE